MTNIFRLSKDSSKITRFIAGTLVLVSFLGLFSSIIGLPNQTFLDSTLPVKADQDQPNLFITKSGQYSYQNGGVISFSSIEDPMLKLSTYKLSGKAQIDIYQASIQDVLDFMTHDAKNNQIKTVKPENLTQIGSLTKDVSEGYDNSDFSLPLPQSGIFMITAKVNETSSKVMVVRSKFGVVLSESPTQYIFWAQDFNTKQSLTSGNITSYNLTNSVNIIEQSDFDSQGIAKTKAVSESDVAIAQNGDDYAVVPINLEYLNVDYGYKRFAQNIKTSKYFVFTDRPIYKPGDKISFKAIIRDEEDVKFSIPKGKVKVTIKNWDQGGTIVLDNKDFQINENGSIFGEATLPVLARSGDYELTVSQVNPKDSDESSYGGSVGFNVNFYKKPEYQLNMKVNKDEIVSGQPLEMNVSASYFSGEPVKNQKVSYRVMAQNFYQYEFQDIDYPIDNFRYSPWGSNIVEEGEVTLDADGKAKVNLDTTKYNLETAKDADPYYGLKGGADKIVTAVAELKDQSQNPVIASQNILSFAGNYNIYRKNYDNYSGTVNQKFNLPLSLVQHTAIKDKQDISDKTITAKIKRTWYEKEEKPDQKYPNWISKEENLPDQTAKTDSKGEVNISFTPKDSGSYKILAQSLDSQNHLISNEFYTWISSIDSPVWSGNESGSLKIEADKPQYKLGDIAKIKIYSDNPNSDVYIAAQRAKQSRFQVVQLDGKTKTIDFPILDTDLPNIYLRASSFSNLGLDTSDLLITVSAETKKLNVTIQPDKQEYGPGDTVKLDITTKDSFGRGVSAESAIWAVDKAIYELRDSNSGGLFETFYSQRYNQADQSNSLRGIAAAQGGAEQGSGCFTGDTGILMADGSQKPIQNIQVGDFIQTRSDENRADSITLAKVNQVMEHTVNGYLILNSSLKVTPEHRIYTKHSQISDSNPLFSDRKTQNSNWVNAGNLQIGDIIFDQTGKEIKITSIEWQAGQTKVYNLEIDKYHTYFAGGIFVHNDKGGTVRDNLADTAYWNPVVKTDSKGKASLTFKLPDNLTTWVIAGISATNDTKIGQTQTEIKATKPIIIRPILPSLLRVDDKNDFSALVFNNSGQDLSMKTELNFPDGEILEQNDKAFEVKNGESKQVFWKVQPKKAQTSSKITFATYVENDTNRGDRVAQELPILNFGYMEKSAQTGDKAKEFVLNQANPDTDLNLSKIDLQLSPTLVGTLPKSMEYLIGYPYGCVEQTTSRFVPAVIALENKDLFSSALKDYDQDKLLEKGVDRLADLQQYDGGWAFWYNGKSDPFISAYVVEYLNKAFVLKPELKDRFMSQAKLDPVTYYSNILNDPNQKEAYIPTIYALTSMNKFELNAELKNKAKVQITDFKDLKPDIFSLAVIANYRNGFTDSKTNGLSQLISMGKIDGDGVYWEKASDERFGGTDASTAFALRAILEAKGDKDIASKAVRFLSKTRVSNYWSNTFATAQTIRSLTLFAKENADFNPNYTYTVLLDGNQIATGKITKATDTALIPVDFKQVKAGGSKLSIVQSGENQKGQIYSTLSVSEFRTDPKFQGQDNGLKISRQYLNTRGENQGLVVGDTVNVKLVVSGLKNPQKYAIISDELPAGLTPINTGLKNEEFTNLQDSLNKNSLENYDYISDIDFTQNGANLNIWELQAKPQTFVYQARVVSSGDFKITPAKAELMYSPEVYALSKADQITTSNTAFTIASNYTPSFKVTGENTPTTTSSSNSKFIENIDPIDQTNQRNILITALVLIFITILGLGGFSLFLAKKHGHGIFSKNPKVETEVEAIVETKTEVAPENLSLPDNKPKPKLKEVKEKVTKTQKPKKDA